MSCSWGLSVVNVIPPHFIFFCLGVKIIMITMLEWNHKTEGPVISPLKVLSLQDTAQMYEKLTTHLVGAHYEKYMYILI